MYRSYLVAAQNLGLAEGASGYWALHIKEDERHGRQMVDEVALPLVDRYELFSLQVWHVDQHYGVTCNMSLCNIEALHWPGLRCTQCGAHCAQYLSQVHASI